MKVELRLVMLVGIIFTHLNNHLIVVDAINISSVVTPSFFDSIINQTSSSCKGKNFYTRAGFLNAAKSFPKFGTASSTIAAKREIAAFFAHATHETGHFCYIDEIGASTKPYCKGSCTYPCKKAKSYHGRGPIQLTWNCNYGACGKSLGLDLLNHPELASTNTSVSFKTALWYWNTRVHSKMSNGFGATIRAINGGECGGRVPTAVANRVKYYKAYCKKFNITPGPKVSC